MSWLALLGVALLVGAVGEAPDVPGRGVRSLIREEDDDEEAPLVPLPETLLDADV